MKNNFRDKIRYFMKSEDGKVGIKSPLTLGMATGSLLLAQAIVGALPAAAQSCNPHGDAHECEPHQFCAKTHCWGPRDEVTGLLTCEGTCQ